MPEKILASFHGIPKSYVDDGDPYPGHCAETVRLSGLGWISLLRQMHADTAERAQALKSGPDVDRKSVV